MYSSVIFSTVFHVISLKFGLLFGGCTVLEYSVARISNQYHNYFSLLITVEAYVVSNMGNIQ